MNDNKPLISIITVVRNGRDVIERTIQSVLEQRYQNIEYIVIDGGSSDGTVDIIKRYAKRITYWVSEPDNGIYDAMNKALDHIRGEGHLFLNAGDYFVGNAIPDHLKLPCYIRVYKKNFFENVRPVRRKNHRLGLPYCHQGILFETRGIRYDLTYDIAADYRYYLDHGYMQLTFCDSSGYVHHDVGLSKKLATIRDEEIASIIRNRFHFGWYVLFRLSVFGKDIIRACFKFFGIVRGL
jgi:glycosyltransferase involved in cell wall biosynthesis